MRCQPSSQIEDRSETPRISGSAGEATRPKIVATEKIVKYFTIRASIAFKFMLRGAEKTEAGELIEVDDGDGGVVFRLPLIDPAELGCDGNGSLETTGGGFVPPPKAPTWEGTVPETAKATHAHA